MLVGGRGELSPDPNWTVRGVVRAMARGFKDQPFALSAALIVLPGIWAAPATVLSSWLIPEAAREADTVPWWLDAGVLSASTIWSSAIYAGQLQIAVDSVRGQRVNWERFRQGIPHTFRLAATVLPWFLPLWILMTLPVEVIEVLALPLFLVVPAALVAVTARTVLWGPWIVDGRLSLRSGWTVTWIATRAQTWRIVRLGFVLAAPLIALFVLEMLALGDMYLSAGLSSGLYCSAAAHLYVLIPVKPEVTAGHVPSGASEAVSEADEDLPRAGSGWTVDPRRSDR
jgi:hypothetical protein